MARTGGNTRSGWACPSVAREELDDTIALHQPQSSAVPNSMSPVIRILFWALGARPCSAGPHGASPYLHSRVPHCSDRSRQTGHPSSPLLPARAQRHRQSGGRWGRTCGTALCLPPLSPAPPRLAVPLPAPALSKARTRQVNDSTEESMTTSCLWDPTATTAGRAWNLRTEAAAYRYGFARCQVHGLSKEIGCGRKHEEHLQRALAKAHLETPTVFQGRQLDL
ncbi:uncharacterized protein [Desmodus rotundus]|uniref:uncharacterized protein n=1 Tax=Desmodus rotundus TaxID=9430 RepID=UPI002380E44D|nr:uncharacterized protein LOC128779344 [Desmodus rotundus]